MKIVMALLLVLSCAAFAEELPVTKNHATAEVTVSGQQVTYHKTTAGTYTWRVVVNDTTKVVLSAPFVSKNETWTKNDILECTDYDTLIAYLDENGYTFSDQQREDAYRNKVIFERNNQQ